MDGHTFLLTLLSVSWMVALIGAGAILLRGVRGRRVGHTPFCAACRQNLSGINLIRRVHCPECGARIHRAAGIVRGRRRTRRLDVAAGVALILLLFTPFPWLLPPTGPPPAPAAAPAVPRTVPARAQPLAPRGVPKNTTTSPAPILASAEPAVVVESPPRLYDLFGGARGNRFVPMWFAPPDRIDPPPRPPAPEPTVDR